MDTNSKRRMQWNQDEMERRRTDRGRQRSEMMAQRQQAAQTQYMDRMSQRAAANGATPGAAGAIAFGESRGNYADRQQGYMTAQAQNDIGMVAAKSPEMVAATRAGADRYVATAGLMGSRYTADRELEGDRYISDANIRSTQIGADAKVKATQIGADSGIKAATIGAMADQQRAMIDQQIADQNRASAEKIAEMKASADTYGGVVPPQQIFDDNGDVTDYLVYDARTGKYVKLSEQN